MSLPPEFQETERLEDVLITSELERRTSRPRDHAAENAALRAIARELGDNPNNLLQVFAEQAMKLCHGDSAGVSLLEPGGSEGLFRWRAIAGELAPNLYGTLPRKASPCGTVLDRDRTLLFNRPARFYLEARLLEPPIYEALLAPFRIGSQPAGTLWVISHSSERHFDAEDARALESLAGFAGAVQNLLSRSARNEDLRASRMAALNLMEDAVQSRRVAENLNRDLQREMIERERAETARHESESLFRQFAENSANVFWIVDIKSRRMEYLSPAYETMFGEGPEAILRDINRWTELIHPEDRDQGADMLERIAAGENLSLDYRIIRPNDGAIRWIRDTGFPIRGVDGKVYRAAGLLQDITEETEKADSLRRSEERFRAVANLVPDLLWSTDGTGAADWFNQRWIDYTGQTVEQGMADGWMDSLHPDDRDEVERKFRAAIAAGQPMRHEQRFRSASGDYRWFLVQKEPVRNIAGQPLRWFAAASDVHEQRTALEAVRESEERFRYLVEGARDYAIFMLDPSNIIVHWNAGAERVFGWTAEEAVGRSGRLVFTPEDKKNKQEEKEIAVAMRAGTAPDKRWHIRKDGSRIWVDGVMHRVNDPKTGALRGFAKVARDATDQRRAQEELEERVKERTAELSATNQKLQEEIQQRSRLEQEILLISEREKRRIGQDLHDSLCQQLAATAFLLETQAHKLSKRNPAQAKNFSEAARTVNDNVGLARDLARGLHPIELSTAGLGNALRELTYRTCHSEHLNCRFIYPRPIRIRDDAVALNFYRIAQEAVNNAIKHGKPTEVTVSLTRKRSGLVLEVSDNGCGLSGSQSGRGMGIDIMRYRANAIGGKLTVKSRDRRGTTVTCILPGK